MGRLMPSRAICIRYPDAVEASGGAPTTPATLDTFVVSGVGSGVVVAVGSGVDIGGELGGAGVLAAGVGASATTGCVTELEQLARSRTLRRMVTRGQRRPPPSRFPTLTAPFYAKVAHFGKLGTRNEVYPGRAWTTRIGPQVAGVRLVCSERGAIARAGGTQPCWVKPSKMTYRVP